MATGARAEGPVIAHSMRTWLPRTQAWLHTQLRSLGDPWHIVVACEGLQNEAEFPGFAVISRGVPMDADGPRAARRPAVDRWRRRRFVAGVLRRHRADLLHAHFGNMAWVDASAALRAGVPLVASFYGFDATLLPRRDPVWRRRYADLFATCEAVLAEGPAMKQVLVDLGCPNDRVRVHHLGADLETLPFQERRGRGPLKILLVGRYVEKKGFPDGLSAIALARRRGLDVRVTLVGGPSGEARSQREDAAIQAVIASKGLGDVIEQPGLLPFPALLDLALRHDVLLCPSRTSVDGDTEGGLPVTLIELGATGMPLVGTRHADIPEFLRHGSNGLLADEGDIEALADALVDLDARRGEWPRMGRASRDLAAAEFDARRQGEALGRLYASLGVGA